MIIYFYHIINIKIYKKKLLNLIESITRVIEKPKPEVNSICLHLNIKKNLLIHLHGCN
jgi:hypothetical protein